MEIWMAAPKAVQWGAWMVGKKVHQSETRWESEKETQKVVRWVVI